MLSEGGIWKRLTTLGVFLIGAQTAPPGGWDMVWGVMALIYVGSFVATDILHLGKQPRRETSS